MERFVIPRYYLTFDISCLANLLQPTMCIPQWPPCIIWSCHHPLGPVSQKLLKNSHPKSKTDINQWRKQWLSWSLVDLSPFLDLSFFLDTVVPLNLWGWDVAAYPMANKSVWWFLDPEKVKLICLYGFVRHSWSHCWWNQRKCWQGESLLSVSWGPGCNFWLSVVCDARCSLADIISWNKLASKNHSYWN